MQNNIDKYSTLPAQIDKLIDKSNAINQIATRAASDDMTALAIFRTFDAPALAQIGEQMQEINRASRVFGRKNSQMTNKLMTLTMLQDTSPYRVMRQCVAEIENRRTAVKEAVFRLKRQRVELQQMLENIEALADHQRELMQIDIEEVASKIEDSMLYLEGAFKDIASFQSAYIQVRDNNGIPDLWDEADFEEAEPTSHVRFAFLLAYRNAMSAGRMDAGTLEYLHQFGVHPREAWNEVNAYIQRADKEQHGYEEFETWLDDMQEKFGENYKKSMARIGLTNIVDDIAVYKEVGKCISSTN